MREFDTNFSITRGRGFQMRLPNGYVVSIQFGPENYCENRCFSVMSEEWVKEQGGKVQCMTAETAVFNSVDGEWAIPPWDTSDSVQGRQSPEDVLKLINWAASLPPVISVNPLKEVKELPPAAG